MIRKNRNDICTSNRISKRSRPPTIEFLNHRIVETEIDPFPKSLFEIPNNEFRRASTDIVRFRMSLKSQPEQSNANRRSW